MTRYKVNKTQDERILGLINDDNDKSSLKELFEKKNELAGEVNRLENEIEENNLVIYGLVNITTHLENAKLYRDELKTWEGGVADINALTRAETNGLQVIVNRQNTQLAANGGGWKTLVKNKYTAALTDNRYSVNANNGNFHTTEWQALKLLGTAICEISNIDKAKFSAEYTGGNKAALEATIDFIQQNKNKFQNGIVNKFVDEEVEEKVGYINDTYNDFNNIFDLLDALNDDALIIKLNNINTITQQDVYLLPKCENDVCSNEELARKQIIAEAGATVYKPGKKVNNEFDSNYQKLEIKDGIKGWVNLARSIFGDDANVFNNRTKLVDSTSWTIPERYLAMNNIVGELEAQKSIKSSSCVELESKNIENKKLITSKDIEVAAKNKEILKITNKSVQHRRDNVLKPYNVEKGFTGDDKRTFDDAWSIKTELENIRFLESGKSTRPSSKGSENTAYKAISDLFEEYQKSDIVLGMYVFNSTEGKTAKERVDKLQEKCGLGGMWDVLEKFQETFKLTESDKEAKEIIDERLGKKQDMTETLDKWQTELKALGSDLDSTIITDSFKTKWNNVNNFKNIAQVKTLLDKIYSDKKVKEDFVTVIKTLKDKDGKSLTDVKGFLKEEPKVVITAVKKYEYDKLGDGAKKDKADKIRKAMGKTKKDDYQFQNNELEEGLYKLAVGLYKCTDDELTTWRNESGTNNPSQEDKSWLSRNKGWVIGGIIVALVSIGIAIYWFKFRNKDEEDSISSESNS